MAPAVAAVPTPRGIVRKISETVALAPTLVIAPATAPTVAKVMPELPKIELGTGSPKSFMFEAKVSENVVVAIVPVSLAFLKLALIFEKMICLFQARSMKLPICFYSFGFVSFFENL